MKPKKRTKLGLEACHEVQIHYKRPLFDSKKKINNSYSAEAILRGYVDPKRIDHKEFFWILLTTNANQVIAVSEIGVGCATGVTVDFKEICQLALLSNTSGLLIAHNHPSGKLEPSMADRQLTKKLKKTLRLLDIQLLDHLIITSESYYSFSDNDLL